MASNIEQLVQRLRQPLKAYFLSIDTTRFLGRVTTFPASADIPGGLQADDWCIRTDLDLPCFYDGTRWLTYEIFSSSGMLTLATTTSGTQALLRVNRTDYALYITRVVVLARVNTTNNGGNFWTMATRGLDAPLATNSVIYSSTTATYTAGTFTALEVAAGAGGFTATPTQYQWFDLALTKTGAPGSIDVASTVYYRQIIT